MNVKPELCDGCGLCIDCCPFGAIRQNGSAIEIGYACKGCELCIKACPKRAIASETEQDAFCKKSDYKGILVYVEHTNGHIATVTLELIGKARELAQPLSQDVYCLFIGTDIADAADALLDYGVRKVFVYQHSAIEYYRADVYANIFYDCVARYRPSAVLVGATSVGRSIAPRVATRCKTGLTADCTALEMREDGNLVQIRPAFGGNIMAQILTKNTRPQFATVRAGVMDTPAKTARFGSIEVLPVPDALLRSNISLANVRKKIHKEGIEYADVLVVAGKAIKTPRDMEMIRELAVLLDGSVASTRPLVEAGLADYSMQIGLSGRSVRPRLMITCGVSGAVQFIAGMKASEYIFAINKNAEAPIMKIADYAAVGDLYEIVPALICRTRGVADGF